MLGYVVRRVLWAAVLFCVVTFVTYVIFFVIPSDAVRTVQGRSAVSLEFRETANLQGSLIEQYGQFLWRVLHGSLGTSFFTEKEVTATLATAAPVTLSLVLGGAVVWMLIALPIGILSALRPRSLLDRAAMVFVLVGISAHPVWIGLIFAYVLGFKLDLFPLTGYCDVFNPSTTCGGPVQWFTHLVLPWLTFATWYAALYVRMIRAEVLEQLNDDHVRTARAKGASEWEVLRSHVLRGALLPVVTMLGVDIGTMGLAAIGSAVFVEQVYSLPGLGRVLYASLQRHDLPITVGVVVFVTGSIVVLNLVVDLLYGAIDPRVRLGARARV